MLNKHTQQQQQIIFLIFFLETKQNSIFELYIYYVNNTQFESYFSRKYLNFFIFFSN